MHHCAMTMTKRDRVAEALGGDPRSLGRLATRIEAGGPAADALLERIYPATGNAHVIGVTGPPGAGKSTVVNRLISGYRSRHRRVAVIAVDPSSPYSGGATLGDRIRMLEFHGDPDVFVRSMAARGHHGGLAATTAGLTHLFDAAAYDPIVVETVGVGQGEVEVATLAHTTAVVQSPGTGDDVQAIKAGILEAAAILVVNKADLPGAAILQRLLQAMLTEGIESGDSGGSWEPPVVMTNANAGRGVETLLAAISAHHSFLITGDGWDRANEARAAAEMATRVRLALQAEATALLSSAPPDVIRRLASRELSPHAATVAILEQYDQRRKSAALPP